MAKIAIIDLLFNWPPDGGARTDIKEIAYRLSNSHEVCIFVPYFDCGFFRGKIKAKLDLNVKRISFTPYTFNFIQAPSKFIKQIKKFNPDYLFITDGWYIKPYMVNILKEYKPILRFYAYEGLCLRSHGHFYINGKICNKNYLHSSLGCTFECLGCAIKWLIDPGDKKFIHEFLTSFAFMPYYPLIVKKAIKNASKIIVYNHFIKNKIKRFNPNITVVDSGINTELFKPADRPHNYKKKILMVGRVEDKLKGFWILYEACRRLYGKRKDFQLIITNDVIKLKEEYITSVGWLTQEELAALYKKVDICVVPSLWPEPFGIVALEAMASAKPVIITKVGGLQRIIKDGYTGFVIQPGNVEELEKKLEILMDDENLRQKLGLNARKVIEENYDWDIVYNKYYANIFK